jgi:aminopeptidase N
MNLVDPYHRRFRFTRKTFLILLAVLAAIAAQAILFNFVFKPTPPPPPSDAQTLPNVTNQDLFFDIDVAHQLFRSRQVITLQNDPASRRELFFMLHPNLIIDTATFQDAHGAPLASTWSIVGPVRYPRFYGAAIFNNIAVQFNQPIAPDQVLTFTLAYHLDLGAFQTGLGRNLYEFFVSSETQHAVGFDSGAFPVIGTNGASPLKISIRHPVDQDCAVPGDPLPEETSPGFVTLHYQAARAYDPAFSCATYHKVQKSASGVSVEFYLLPGGAYSDKMSDIALATLALYHQMFGSPASSTFRFVFLPMEYDAGGAESKGNTVYLGKSSNFDDFDQDPDRQRLFMALAGHEAFHNWNTFYSQWSGKLDGWWSEGGATFMGIFATETLWGEANAREIRGLNLQNFIREMGYLSPGTLEYPNNIWKNSTWQGEWTLVYDYGSLVWEQLRQKMGDDALIAGLRDFLQQSASHPSGYTDLIACLQRHTSLNVAAFLAQWITHNVQIDLVMKSALTRPAGAAYETTLTYTVVSDRDYDVSAAFGYKTAASPDWIILPLTDTQWGTHTMTFTTPDPPLELQLDPDFRLPQNDLTNDHWPILPQ